MESGLKVYVSHVKIEAITCKLSYENESLAQKKEKKKKTKESVAFREKLQPNKVSSRM